MTPVWAGLEKKVFCTLTGVGDDTTWMRDVLSRVPTKLDRERDPLGKDRRSGGPPRVEGRGLVLFSKKGGREQRRVNACSEIKKRETVICPSSLRRGEN